MVWMLFRANYVTRRVFDNYAEYIDLYGHEEPVPESIRPRIIAQRLIPPDVRARLGIAPARSDQEVARLIALAHAVGR